MGRTDKLIITIRTLCKIMSEKSIVLAYNKNKHLFQLHFLLVEQKQTQKGEYYILRDFASCTLRQMLFY
jgi:hypothetical protein